jgi:hypothetical protein
LKLHLDEHFGDELAEALCREIPGLDVTTSQTEDLLGLQDPPLLELLDEQGRTLATRDVNSLRRFASARMAAGLTHGGIILVGKSTRQTDVKGLLRRLVDLVKSKGGEDWTSREEWL